MASRIATVSLATGLAGTLLGSYHNAPPAPLPVTLEGTTVIRVHPAALDLRTAAGQEQHFLIDPLDRQWADVLPIILESAGIWSRSPVPTRAGTL